MKFRNIVKKFGVVLGVCAASLSASPVFAARLLNGTDDPLTTALTDIQADQGVAIGVMLTIMIGIIAWRKLRPAMH